MGKQTLTADRRTTASLQENRAQFPGLPVLLLVIAALVLLWRLGDGPLGDWDEAIYAQVSKEIVQTGDWITLHWQFQPWYEKPPLFIWATAAFFHLFGTSEFSARTASAVSGVGLVLVTYLIGKLQFGRWAGLLAGVVLLTSFQFISAARFGTTDVMLSLWLYVALYGYLKFEGTGDARWWYGISAAIALAVMTKGAAAVIGPAVIGVAVILNHRSMAALRSKHFWGGCILGALLVLPWHFVLYHRAGEDFLSEYIGYHTLSRATSSLEGNIGGPLYYVRRLAEGFMPWLLLSPIAIAASMHEIWTGKRRSLAIFLAGAFVFGLYTLVKTKLPWYIVPMYPALALLIGGVAVRAWENWPRYRRAILAVCAISIVAGVGHTYFISHQDTALNLVNPATRSVARLASLARATDPADRDFLILYADAEADSIDNPAALFYSNRPLRHAFAFEQPPTHADKHHMVYENLAGLTEDSARRRMILHSKDATRLAEAYDLQVIAQESDFSYALVRRLQKP